MTKKIWRKEKEAEGIALILFYVAQGKRVSVLLPIDRELGDFEIKMQVLIKMLAQVESRFPAEILETLASKSSI